MSSIDELAGKALETVKNTATTVWESDALAKVVDTVENEMIPQLVAAASFTYGMLFPQGKDDNKQTIAPGPSLAVTPSTSKSSTSMAFFYGIVLGMGLSHELYRRRVFDKLRLSLFSWLYQSNPNEGESGEEFLTKKFRDPVQLDTLEGKPMPGSEREDNSGILKELLSPAWALTSSLHVALLTLPFGAELTARKSNGVEFYYVVSGDGTYTYTVVDGGEEIQTVVPISTGSAWLVDPGVFRGFSANRRGQLVLLRATDVPVEAGYDVTRKQLNASYSSSQSVMAAVLERIDSTAQSAIAVGLKKIDSTSRVALSAGLRKIEELYTKYSQSKGDEFEMLD